MYRVEIQMIGGNGRYGYDYWDRADFDTYAAAYNAVRRWRRKIKRENIDAEPVRVKRL